MSEFGFEKWANESAAFCIGRPLNAYRNGPMSTRCTHSENGIRYWAPRYRCDAAKLELLQAHARAEADGARLEADLERARRATESASPLKSHISKFGFGKWANESAAF